MMALAATQPFPIIESSGVFPELLGLIHRPYAPGIGTGGLIKTAGLPDGVRDILLEDYTFRFRGILYTVPKGFVTDYASVPRIFQRILPQRGKYNPAAVAHDWLYWSGVLPKHEADLALLDLSQRLKVPWRDRTMLYRGVWIGGGPAWRSYRNGKGREFQAVAR